MSDTAIRKRENWLDSCKGIAIMLVVVGHIIDGNMAKGTLSGHGFEILYDVIYMFHMPLFFLLSGMAFATSKRKNFTGGGIESCCNLLILYVFWQMIYNLFRKVFSSAVNKQAADSLFRELIAPHTLYWYLLALLSFYLMFYIFANRLGKKGIIVFLCVSIIASGFIPNVYHVLFDGRTDFLYKLIYHLAFFAMGHFAYNNKDLMMGAIIKGKIILPIVAVTFLIPYIACHECVYYPFVKFIMALTVSLGILSVVINIKPISENKLLCYFGKNSLYIYLIHNYITVALRMIYIRLGFEIPGVIYFVGCIVITLIVCSMVHLFVIKLWPMDIFFRPVKTLRRFLRGSI